MVNAMKLYVPIWERVVGKIEKLGSFDLKIA